MLQIKFLTWKVTLMLKAMCGMQEKKKVLILDGMAMCYLNQKTYMSCKLKYRITYVPL